MVWRVRDIAGSPAISKVSHNFKRPEALRPRLLTGLPLYRQIYTPDIILRNLSSAPDIDFNWRH